MKTITVGKKKQLLISAAVILLLCTAVGGGYLLKVQRYQKAVQDLPLSAMTAEGIADGIYTGECDVDFIRAKVSVTVENEAIVRIVLLEHKNGRGVPAEHILAEMIEGQTTDVDAVSGASNSCRVIRYAVENALRSAELGAEWYTGG